jgi:hypothetical protein
VATTAAQLRQALGANHRTSDENPQLGSIRLLLSEKMSGRINDISFMARAKRPPG